MKVFLAQYQDDENLRVMHIESAHLTIKGAAKAIEEMKTEAELDAKECDVEGWVRTAKDARAREYKISEYEVVD